MQSVKEEARCGGRAGDPPNIEGDDDDDDSGRNAEDEGEALVRLLDRLKSRIQSSTLAHDGQFHSSSSSLTLQGA